MDNLHEKISIVSTAPSRLFYDENHGLWEGIQKYYPNVNFYFYHENSFEKKQTGEFIDFEKIGVPKNYHEFDLFELYEGLDEFLKTSKFNICDKLEGAPGTNEYWIKNSIYWFRKTPAIYHASRICKTPLLLFLDADSNITPLGSGNVDEYTIDENYINFALSHDVLSRHRKPMHTETGHIVFNLEKRGQEFVDNFYNYYINGNAFEEERWDDCWIFDTLTEKLNVSNGPLSVATGAPHDFECIVDHNKGMWHKIRTSRGGGL
tara:strand:+ start:3275 stop:4063 length:789 start_codon:yes stop_codon:yes gene_type:complete